MRMKIIKSNWYARFLRRSKGVFRGNPILGLGLALPFAAAAATSMQTAVGLSIGMLLTIFPVCLLMPLIIRLVPENLNWLEIPITVMLAAFFVMPIRLAVGSLSPALMDSVGVYFSLLCVSSLLFSVREKTRYEKGLYIVLLDLLCLWLGAVIVLLIMGCIREVLGNGTLWGKPVTWMKIRFSAVMLTGTGFIFLGFLSALGRKIHRIILTIPILIEDKLTPIRERVSELSAVPIKEDKKKKSEGKEQK